MHSGIPSRRSHASIFRPGYLRGSVYLVLQNALLNRGTAPYLSSSILLIFSLLFTFQSNITNIDFLLFDVYRFYIYLCLFLFLSPQEDFIRHQVNGQGTFSLVPSRLLYGSCDVNQITEKFPEAGFCLRLYGSCDNTRISMQINFLLFQSPPIREL